MFYFLPNSMARAGLADLVDFVSLEGLSDVVLRPLGISKRLLLFWALGIHIFLCFSAVHQDVFIQKNR